MVVSNISFVMPIYLPGKGLLVWCGGFVLAFVWFACLGGWGKGVFCFVLFSIFLCS